MPLGICQRDSSFIQLVGSRHNARLQLVYWCALFVVVGWHIELLLGGWPSKFLSFAYTQTEVRIAIVGEPHFTNS